MTSSLMSGEAKAAVLILLYRSPRPALAAGGSADSTRMMSIAPAAHSPCYPLIPATSGNIAASSNVGRRNGV
jgi:hypothetical protein